MQSLDQQVSKLLTKVETLEHQVASLKWWLSFAWGALGALVTALWMKGLL